MAAFEPLPRAASRSIIATSPAIPSEITFSNFSLTKKLKKTKGHHKPNLLMSLSGSPASTLRASGFPPSN